MSIGAARSCGGVLVLDGRAKDTIILSTGFPCNPSWTSISLFRMGLIYQWIAKGILSRCSPNESVWSMKDSVSPVDVWSIILEIESVWEATRLRRQGFHLHNESNCVYLGLIRPLRERVDLFTCKILYSVVNWLHLQKTWCTRTGVTADLLNVSVYPTFCLLACFESAVYWYSWMRSGENVEPAEIEEAVMQSNLIQQVVVVGQVCIFLRSFTSVSEYYRLMW